MGEVAKRKIFVKVMIYFFKALKKIKQLFYDEKLYLKCNEYIVLKMAAILDLMISRGS